MNKQPYKNLTPRQKIKLCEKQREFYRLRSQGLCPGRLEGYSQGGAK